jgi:steroid 5-alpha reductase family enzyme
MLGLAALGWLIAAAAMTSVWAWEARARRPGISAAIWPALVGALAVLYANLGTGEWVRRSAIAWMMGSWGARLAVQGLYTCAARTDGDAENSRPFWYFQALAAAAVAASVPALLASLNHRSQLSVAELTACAVWIAGFAGETTADRQRLRFASDPANEGLRCRTGLWQYFPHARQLFESMIWAAYAIFALAAIWGGSYDRL